MSKVGSRAIITNFTWRLFERIGAQGVTFIVSVILARLLEPSIYGMVAIITVFTTIMQIFVDSGLGNALIQKENADYVDFSSVFFFNLFFCIVLYLVVFFAAPLIARFYSMVDLVSPLRVLGLTIVISGIKNVQQAYVSRNLMFKRFFFSTLGGTIGASIIGILMAFNGYGVWALIIQNVFNQAIDTLILWITVKWRPKAVFSVQRVKQLFSFGWKLLLAKLIDAVYTDLSQLIIGKKYTANDLAYYNRAYSLPKVFVNTMNTAITSVLFPILAKEQSDLSRIRIIVRKSLLINTFIYCPIMIWISVCSEPLIRLLLTEKWLPCVPYLRLICFTYCFTAFNTSNQNAFQALGRSDIYLRNEVVSKIIGLASMLSTIWISVYALVVSSVIACLINTVVFSWPNKKNIGYGFFEQIKDVIPIWIVSLIMGLSVFAISLLNLCDSLTILLDALLGVSVYLGCSAGFKLESFSCVQGMINSLFHKDIEEKTEANIDA